jgi:hypothetical protein
MERYRAMGSLLEATRAYGELEIEEPIGNTIEGSIASFG